MIRRTCLLIAALILAVVAGCYTGPDADSHPSLDSGSSTDDAGANPGDDGRANAAPEGTSGAHRKVVDSGREPADAPADDAPADASVDGASVCTSGTTWAHGTPASELMHPGMPCVLCHAAMGGPALALAGTLFPTLHEPNDCNGSGGNASVLIIDAAGKTHTLKVNAAGNFMRVASIPLPYRAIVVSGANVREMKTPQTDGDCNGCHSEAATRAPGRVMAP